MSYRMLGITNGIWERRRTAKLCQRHHSNFRLPNNTARHMRTTPPKCKSSIDTCKPDSLHIVMIKSFISKPLKALWETGLSKIDARMHPRILRRLDALDAATAPEDMNLPGFNFHALRGHNPTRYSVHINGPWCITFEFRDGDAYVLDFEQYH